MSATGQALGAAGEAMAARWYRRRGYRIVDRNWRWGRRGELDLVVRRGRLLVFCEVKTRRHSRLGDPLRAVDDAKAHQVRRLARRWMVEHETHHLRVRYDVAAVLAGRLSMHRDAF